MFAQRFQVEFLRRASNGLGKEKRGEGGDQAGDADDEEGRPPVSGPVRQGPAQSHAQGAAERHRDVKRGHRPCADSRENRSMSKAGAIAP